MNDKVELGRLAESARGARRLADEQEGFLLAAMGVYLDGALARELALEIGVSPQYLSDVRHGRRRISGEFLGKVAGLRSGV